MTLLRWPARALAIALMVPVIAAATVSTAIAHVGEGILVVESQEPAGSGSVRYVVRLTWAGDGHPALGSTLTATPIAPDGTPQTPVPLEGVDEDGRYTASVPFGGPGEWTLRFTAVSPTGSIEVSETVAEATTTTTAAVATTERDAAAEDALPAERGDEGRDPDDAGGSGIGGALALGFLVVIVVAAVVGFARSTRRLRGET